MDEHDDAGADEVTARYEDAGYDEDEPLENGEENGEGALEMEVVEIGTRDEAAPSGPNTNRTTSKYMTKYEKARVLGTRALQISMNAPVMVNIEGETDALKIAHKELREGKIPMIIRRYLPDNSYEDWPIDQLIVE
mmetsp:Transcript_11119/g.33830  ORF Transcript_11119/g.33830 Transcript_11119/m.33830 type:complete len:136 (-) Transcript_11119:725-1132(-)